MKRSPLNRNQTRNARYILERAREAKLSKNDAYTAAWFAFAESSLGENLKSNKDQTGAQVTVLLADLQRYRGEFNRLLDGADPEAVFKGNPQGSKAWERFIDPANGVPFTFEDFAYLRHNTSVNQTKRVNGLRTGDPDGAYEAIRNETDIVFNPAYEPGPYTADPKDISDGLADMTDNATPLTDLSGFDDDEEQHFGPSPGL